MLLHNFPAKICKKSQALKPGSLEKKLGHCTLLPARVNDKSSNCICLLLLAINVAEALTFARGSKNAHLPFQPIQSLHFIVTAFMRYTSTFFKLP